MRSGYSRLLSIFRSYWISNVNQGANIWSWPSFLFTVVWGSNSFGNAWPPVQYIYQKKETRPPSSRPSHQQMIIWHCMYYEPTPRRWYGMLLTKMVRQMWILKITDGKSRMACPCLWHTMARLHHPASCRSLLVNVAAIWVGVPQMPAVSRLHKHLAQLIANATLETTAKMSWLYMSICLTTATLMLNSFHTSSNTVCVSWNV